MAGAPEKDEVQRVTIEIPGPQDKKVWEQFKKDMAAVIKKHKKVKARIKHIAYEKKGKKDFQ